MASFGSYYRLTKPGIIYGNALAGLAGFGLAISGSWSVMTLLSVMAGMCLVMASGCVANNVIDRTIDARMERTKKRALVTGTISIRQAMVFATVLGVIGFSILALGTNWLTVGVGALALFDYVVLYAWAKRHTSWSTLVGSISGALPPVGGYVALSGTLDANALFLFLAMTAWQMPHFYAIGLYRGNDYGAADLPLLTQRAPRKTIGLHSIVYVVGYLIANIALWHLGSASNVFVVIMSILGTWWLIGIIKGFGLKFSDKWARNMFGHSLLILTSWCALLIINNWLP